jgi:hypothetical protein
MMFNYAKEIRQVGGGGVGKGGGVGQIQGDLCYAQIWK